MTMVARLGDQVVGVSVHYGPPVPPSPVGPPVPFPVSGTLQQNPIGLPTDVAFFVGGAQVAYEGASGVHGPPVCISPLGTAVTSLDPTLHHFKVPISLPSLVPVLINGKKPLLVGSLSQHCHDIVPAPTNALSVGTVVTGSLLLNL